MKIKIVEVGPRDGLQNEKQSLTVRTRLHLIHKLLDTGLKHIEAGAFVSPEWVPQMEGSKELIEALLENKQYQLNLSALVPNEKGLEIALDAGLREIAIFGACSETFSQKNINCSIDESFKKFQKVCEHSLKKGLRIRAYLSTAFECPYEGLISIQKVKSLTQRFFDLGVYEVSISDTIGSAHPLQVKHLMSEVGNQVSVENLALHFHDTQGMALANVCAGLELGIRIFDSSIGGLGGCPYAKGASGNVATEDLCNMLAKMGYETGVDLDKLKAITLWLEGEMGRSLGSKISKITKQERT